MADSRKRKPVAAPSTQELLKSDFARRKLDRELQACETARQMLSLCHYNRAKNHAWYVAPSEKHAIFGMRARENSFIQAWVASPMRWLDDVYKKGLAVASGCFVFEVMQQQEDGSLVVLTGKQGRGCSVNLAYAGARAQGNSWLLEWKGLPEDFRVKLPKMETNVDAVSEMSGEYYRRALARRAVETLDAKYGKKPETGSS